MFTDVHSEPIHPHAISQSFERIACRAGVRVIRLHDFRHTHGTLLIAAGVPVKVVSERLGHATPGGGVRLVAGRDLNQRPSGYECSALLSATTSSAPERTRRHP